MLRKSRDLYNARWVRQSKSNFGTDARPETVAQHVRYWDAICKAVETSEFDELLRFARDAGRFQYAQGFDLSDAVRRTVEATNLIEISLLETGDSDIPAIDIVNEVADLRSTIVMAVAEGYKSALDEKRDSEGKGNHSNDQLRALVMNERRAVRTDLVSGDEIPPRYDGGTRFHFIDRGKLRLYNLLPNGRCITISILSANDVFLQWADETQSLSCLCAEAMEPTSIVSLSQNEIAAMLTAQPTAALDVITNFARRLTESQVLIEDLMNNSVNLRLYRTLLELRKQFGKPDAAGGQLLDLSLTHQRLADMIGSNRVTVTRKLHELGERGIIETRKNATIVVLRPDELARLAALGASA